MQKLIQNSTQKITKKDSSNQSSMLTTTEESVLNLDSKSSTESKSSKLSHKSYCWTEGRWTLKDHKMFVDLLLIYGNNWGNIQTHIESRCTDQIRSHSQKFFLKLSKLTHYSKWNALKLQEFMKTIETEKLQLTLDALYKLPYLRHGEFHDYKKKIQALFGANCIQKYIILKIKQPCNIASVKDIEIPGKYKLELSEEESKILSITKLLIRNEEKYSISNLIYNPFHSGQNEKTAVVQHKSNSFVKTMDEETYQMPKINLNIYRSNLEHLTSVEVESKFIESFIPIASGWRESADMNIQYSS